MSDLTHLPQNISDDESECEYEEPTPPQDDIVVEFDEVFDQHKLNYIISNKEKFKKQMRDRCFENDYNPFAIIEKYLRKSRNGTMKVQYKQTEGKGRFYAIGSLSMQSMPREVRHTIASEYIDIDMVNAHPVILSHLCKGRGIKTKYLDKYIVQRDKMLSGMGADGKTLVLSLINGGKKAYDELESKPRWLTLFKKEIDKIHSVFATDPAYEKHRDKRVEEGFSRNHKASYMNVLLCDFENTILQQLHTFFGEPHDCVLCFDGIMLRLGNYDLKACEGYVYEQLGIQIQLKIKPMTEGFEIGDVPPYDEPRTVLYTDFESLVGKTVYPQIVQEWCNNTIVLINNGGNQFFLTKNKRIDSLTKEQSIYYKQITEKNIMQNLRVSCNVINEGFDYEFWMANKDKKMKEIDPKDHDKMNRFSFDILGPSGMTTRGFLEAAIKQRNLSSFNHVEFYPFLGEAPKLYDGFNIFTGFPIESIPLTIPQTFEQSLLYKHLGDEMMNGEQGEFDHFLDHIADMIQQPAQIRGPSHLFYTAPGMGKGMMAMWMSRLLGSNHVITFGDTATYFSNFNSEQANKILKIFEEVSDKGEAFHKHDRLKGDQTKTHERIEPKGVDSYLIRHCARFWYYTNNQNALYIENNDRRHTLHRANNRYANKIDYFNKLWAEVKDEAFCRMCFDYFAHRAYEEMTVLTAYDTKYKNEQKISNMPNGVKFLVELIESNFEGVVRDGYKVSAKSLSDRFKEWCGEHGTKFSLSAFKSQIQKVGIGEPKGLRVYGKKTKCYTIVVDELRESFRVFLKQPEFDFDIICDSDSE